MPGWNRRGKKKEAAGRDGACLSTAFTGSSANHPRGRVASGPSGAVDYGQEIDEAAAVALRQNKGDIVIRGNDSAANRRLAYKIEAQVGPPSRPQFPPTTFAGPMALPHFHQLTRSPEGHTFYETDKRKARRKR